MKISIIAAIGKSFELGINGRLPWKLRDDSELFKKLTSGHKIIMGRKTFESIGHSLPNRENIIFTNHPNFSAPGCRVVHSLDQALEKTEPDEEVFIIGGGQIYTQALPLTQKMYLTHVSADIKADAFFPEFDPRDWTVTYTKNYNKNERNEFSFTFTIYERKNSV